MRIMVSSYRLYIHAGIHPQVFVEPASKSEIGNESSVDESDRRQHYHP